jgi:hypothetical protein
MMRAASSATWIDIFSNPTAAVDGLAQPVAHDLALNRDEVLHGAAA